MVISPAQLVDEPLKLDETIAPGAIEYAPDIRQVGPLTVKGQAELIVEHRGPKEFVRGHSAAGELFREVRAAVRALPGAGGEAVEGDV